MGTIETVYRTFPLEVLAGDHDMDVEVKVGREGEATTHHDDTTAAAATASGEGVPSLP